MKVDKKSVVCGRVCWGGGGGGSAGGSGGGSSRALGSASLNVGQKVCISYNNRPG